MRVSIPHTAMSSASRNGENFSRLPAQSVVYMLAGKTEKGVTTNTYQHLRGQAVLGIPVQRSRRSVQQGTHPAGGRSGRMVLLRPARHRAVYKGNGLTPLPLLKAMWYVRSCRRRFVPVGTKEYGGGLLPRTSVLCSIPIILLMLKLDWR